MLSDGTHRRMVWKERRKDRVGCESRDTAQHTVLYPTLLEYHHILHLGLKKINVVTMKNPEFRTAWERNTVVSLILWTQPLPQSQKPSSGRLCTSKGKTPWIVTTCPRDTLPAVPQMGCCFGSDRGSTPILESDPVLLTVKHLLRTLAWDAVNSGVSESLLKKHKLEHFLQVLIWFMFHYNAGWVNMTVGQACAQALGSLSCRQLFSPTADQLSS